MKNLLAAGVSALALLSVAPALAADLPARMVTKAPAYVQVYNWTGFYIGAHAGYGWADSDLFASGNQDGFLVGAQIGYNWQAPGSNWVFGLELDSAWANIDTDGTFTGGGVTGAVSSEIDYIGSFRGRVGYAWDRTLLYVTGGLGWAHNDVTSTVIFPGITTSTSTDNTHIGYVLGAGVEYAFAGPWSVKGEYLYYGLGSERYLGTTTGDQDLNIQTVKIGLNYRFGAPY
jgi:outer membrane immunogenic protein